MPSTTRCLESGGGVGGVFVGGGGVCLRRCDVSDVGLFMSGDHGGGRKWMN
jgi:hypothetical protein